mmetsp:Transcript_58451/g.148169  ORF Transcript_58451/g.148169 Transcript_58451/m.148169 type:complete len:401 (-) Transcript_58451:50-1252(-)
MMEAPGSPQPQSGDSDDAAAAASASAAATAPDAAIVPAAGMEAMEASMVAAGGGDMFADASGAGSEALAMMAAPPPSFWSGEMVPDALLSLGGDAKTMLNTFCQRYTNRSTTKQCIMYEAIKFGSQFQATVTLNCLGGRTFAGELATNRKEAEQNAAKIALDNYYWDIMTLPPPGGKNKKRTASASVDYMAGMPPGGGPLEPGLTSNPRLNNKVMLNTALMRILKRPLTKDDVCKNTVQTSLGYQCTISLPGMPGEWAGLAWAGEVAPNQKEAEEHAAKYALDAINKEPSFSIMMTEKPAKVPRTGDAPDMQAGMAGVASGFSNGDGFGGGFGGCDGAGSGGGGWQGGGNEPFIGDWASGWTGGWQGDGGGGKGKGKGKNKSQSDSSSYDGGWGFPFALT